MLAFVVIICYYYFYNFIEYTDGVFVNVIMLENVS